MKLTGWRKRLVNSIRNADQICAEAQKHARPEYYDGAMDALDLVVSFIVVDEYESSSRTIPMEEMEFVAGLRTLLNNAREDIPKNEDK